MNTKNFKYFSGLISALIVFICLCFIIVANGILIIKTTDNTSVAGLFGFKAVISVSDIENTDIKKNDLLFFKKADEKSIFPGSIICCFENNVVRICTVKSERTQDGIIYYTVDGIHDSYVIRNKEITLGKIDSVYINKKLSGVGSCINFMQSTLGTLILVILPISAATFANMLFGSMQSRKERKKREVMEKELMMLRKMSSDK